MKALSSKQQVIYLLIYLFVLIMLFNFRFSLVGISYFVMTGIWTVATLDPMLKKRAAEQGYRFSFLRFFYYLHDLLPKDKFWCYLNSLLGALIFFAPVIIWQGHWNAFFWILLSYVFFLSIYKIGKFHNESA